MKKLILVCCLLTAGICVYASAIRDESDVSSDKSRTSYAFGMVLGNEISSSGIEIDYKAFSTGLQASMEKQDTQFTMDEAVEMVDAAFQAATTQRNDANRAKEQQFLSDNGQKPEVTTTASGLQYEALVEGDGAKPEATDTVKVYYEGKLTDGTVFDSRQAPDDPAQIPLSGVISGWSEGLQLMSVGSTYRLTIPSSLAYGERGAGQIIPPFSTLIFTVQLLDIVKADAADTQDNSVAPDASDTPDMPDMDSQPAE